GLFCYKYGFARCGTRYSHLALERNDLRRIHRVSFGFTCGEPIILRRPPAAKGQRCGEQNEDDAAVDRAPAYVPPFDVEFSVLVILHQAVCCCDEAGRSMKE